MTQEQHPSSFRDPSGFLFRQQGVLLRQVNASYAPHYDRLIDSGLYEALVGRGWLIPHVEIDLENPQGDNEVHRVLKPQIVPFVSYPYEWSFSEYRAAALLTLDIQKLAIEHGMTLKDASAYNVQFIGSRPTLIDTLSFENYEEGSPWVAYRQYCQHFLAPLALMSYRDVRLSQLMRSQIDGLPLDLACSVLPRRAMLRFGLLTNLFLHAKSQKSKADSQKDPKTYSVSKLALQGLVESLRKATARLEWKLPDTEWGDYYSATNYSSESHRHKAELVEGYLARVNPHSVWDLGANTGRFSRLASAGGAFTVAFDIDPVAVEKNFLAARKQGDESLLALQLDLANPSPDLGWAHGERQSLVERGPADVVMALALIHHLTIGNNVPLRQVADFFASLCQHLIIEFVPKEDSQVKRLLATREDVFPDYNHDGFLEAFKGVFELVDEQPVGESERTLYLLSRRN